MRGARLIVEHEGSKRKLCKIFFTKSDASIYVQPYWSGSPFYSGSEKFVPGQRKNTFKYTDGQETGTCPKLSYHESGCVHIKAGKDNIAEVSAAPVGEIQGEEAHILTLLIDDLANLPLLKTDLRWNTNERDFKCFSKSSVSSAKVTVYALSGKADQLDGCPLSFHLERKSESRITTFGVRMVGQNPVGNGQLIILAGWEQDASDVDKPGEFIFVASNPPLVPSGSPLGT